MPIFTNLAAYRFAPLENLKYLRHKLLDDCKTWQLKGTILLSSEGINLFVAGSEEAVQRLLDFLQTIPGLAELAPKFSSSDQQPFSRMLVRIKKEIISFGVAGIDPAKHPSPKIAPEILKLWLDQGRPVTLLDTRNDYETKLGTFNGAITLGIDHFRQLPDAVRRLPAAMKKQPVVMFCTGGIRCEKAGPFMEKEGFEHIFQLDGGILRYFEECGGQHYQGECFVFDQRVGVDPALRETDAALCHVCQTPLTPAEQADARYVPNQSCPWCFKTPAEEMAGRMEGRHEILRKIAPAFSVSEPYENRRPLNIPGYCEGATLLECLLSIFPQIPESEWRKICESGGFRDRNDQPVATDARLHAGDRLTRVLPGTIEPPVSAAVRILYEDEAIVVLDKPAPLPMHPGGRFHRHTLQQILQTVYAPQKIQAAHRLDANTTGVVVCTRLRRFASLLQPQFAAGTVTKVYLARVTGQPDWERFTSHAPIGDQPGEVGARQIDEEGGRKAESHFRVLKCHPDGTTLLEVRPLTGRTNQIRIHLWQLGFPVCGDPTYLLGNAIGHEQTLPLDAPPLCLHAWQLAFDHPLTGQRVSFAADPPNWANGWERA